MFHDFGRDFDSAENPDAGPLAPIRIALADHLVVTVRQHPVRCADAVRRKLEGGWPVHGPAQALDLLVTVISQNVAALGRSLSRQVQAAEDALLDDRQPPGSRDLIAIRRRLAQLHRMLEGMRGVAQRLEEDDDLPEDLAPTVEKIAQRLQALDGDILNVQRELRQLRDEIETEAAQRTNQNLYILSLVTALMLPATVVTGVFGMNTGGMPFAASGWGTFGAAVLAVGSAALTWLVLRWLGFMRR